MHRVIFEVRYDYGYTYLDRCGITVNDLLRKHAGWTVDQTNPQSGTLKNEDIGATLAFDPQKLNLNFQQSARVDSLPVVEDMARLSADFATTVLENLGIQDVTRVGLRVWQLFGRGSLGAAKERVKELGFVDLGRIQKTGLDQLDEVSFSVVAERDDLRSRVALSAVEQQIKVDPTTVRTAHSEPSKLPKAQRQALMAKLKAQKVVSHYPQYAVLVDIDTLSDYPPPVTKQLVQEYVSENYGWSVRFAYRFSG